MEELFEEMKMRFEENEDGKGFRFESFFIMGDRRSKEDDLQKISISIFVTNFPEQTNAKELWSICKQYGNVIDAYIPIRRSKIGKRFGFVQFIKVSDVDRLVNNLCLIWISSFKLHVNVARFNRLPLNKGSQHADPTVKVRIPYVETINRGGAHGISNSYIQAFKTGTSSHTVVEDSKPSMVLDHSCYNNFDSNLSLVGKLKEFGSLPNIKKLLEEEGFADITIRYMGGFWVLFQFLSQGTKDNFKSHVGVNSWFSLLQQVSNSFCIDERVAWIDIEGVPLCVWSRNTFDKISSKWGSLLHEEEEDDSYFHRKRLCIKTIIAYNIFESFKIIVKGKIFWIRAKEVTGWAPKFSDTQDVSSDSDVGSEDVNGDALSENGKDDLQSEVEEIPETVFEEGEIKSTDIKENSNEVQQEAQSDDPFNIYDLLKSKHPVSNATCQSEEEPKYPPGFTPRDNSVNFDRSSGGADIQQKESSEKENGSKTCFKEDVNASVCSGHFKKVGSSKTDGTILQLIEDLIKVGQTMGYKMEGCINDIEEIETKMEQASLFDIKSCWGNLIFDFVDSPSVGNSGGILCVWDTNMFHKENATVSDYFIAIMGKWLPKDRNLLIITVYALQELSEKRMLWQYLNHLIDGWKGDVIVMGDFNEVRSAEERFGSIFNVRGAAAFNSFITSGGLIEVPSGGYSFTWSHKSAAKMSKLDRFLVSKDLMSYCPNLSTIILDRYLSDHRPILLREMCVDYGPTPFRFFNYWFEFEGFDSFVADTWRNTNILEPNAMLKLIKKLKLLKGCIRTWVNDKKDRSQNLKKCLKNKLSAIDISLDKGEATSAMLDDRLNIMNNLTSLENNVSLELAQKAKIKWAIEGDENSKKISWYWSLIEGDVVEDVNYFFHNGYCPKGGNSSFITLIPKIPVTVMSDLVNEVQSAFIANRQILDGPFMLNEIIHWCKAKKKQTMIFKVDFEKAFDSVRWDFLDDVLTNFGFGTRWRDWIQSCLKSSRGSILVNGSPTSEFQFYKGLKQGDSPSPFLFIFVMESLHPSFHNIFSVGLFKGVALNTSLQISHIFYADDVVFVGQWCDSNLSTIIRVLDFFLSFRFAPQSSQKQAYWYCRGLILETQS
ncbi:RNA-directed DNA polymerase, eukaryota [Tanacetum coccineum]|uniref:RNA-directed DNA polymerase, eukaryota n=1 Tax=Tanacetum coccineum TaxID=301880 RepID=A0ABQ5FA46_9ASTR